MGAWGTGIYQNDVGDEVKDDYISKLKGGKSDEDALSEILEEYQNELLDDEEKCDVIFALADVMWKKGRLTEDIKEKALEYIEYDLQLDRWETQGELKKRNKVLEKLKNQIISKMPERKKIPIHKPVVLGWSDGEVYAFQIKSEIQNYEKYKGWYAIFYIKKIYKKDWQVKGVFDEVAEAYFYLVKDKPSAPSIIENATPVCFLIGKRKQDGSEPGNQYLVDILETSKRMRPKDLFFVGRYENDKIFHPKEHESKGLIFWLLYERDILWGYKNQLKYEGRSI